MFFKLRLNKFKKNWILYSQRNEDETMAPMAPLERKDGVRATMASKTIVMLTTLGASFVPQTTQGWTTGGITGRSSSKATTTPLHSRKTKTPSNDDSDPFKAALQSQQQQQQQNNIIFEAMSIQGAEKIAKMSIPERAKRAMLAEATEDRIFELTERLEGLMDQDNGGSISAANRDEAMDLAQQAKKLQMQYNDLVNGNPSSILQAIDAMGEIN
jgi:hypothetical protein